MEEKKSSEYRETLVIIFSSLVKVFFILITIFSRVIKSSFPQMSTSEVIVPTLADDKRLSNISENSEDSCHSHSSEGLTYSQTVPSQAPHTARYAHTHLSHSQMPKVLILYYDNFLVSIHAIL